MPDTETRTHTGLAVDAVKVLPNTGLSAKAEKEYADDSKELTEAQMAEKYGAGYYNFVVNLDGVDVVIGSAKAGTIDQQRAAIQAAKPKRSKAKAADAETGDDSDTE